MTEIRLGLTLPGAVSLGAYEAGACTALLLQLRSVADTHRRDPSRSVVRIDSIASSSSGSLTALLTAQCLLRGLDPGSVMWQAWVAQASLSAMLTGGTSAPLTLDRIRRTCVDLITQQTPHPDQAQPGSVRLSMALFNLRGAAVDLDAMGTPDDLVVRHLDWQDVLLTGDTDPVADATLDVAFASAANQLAFPPVFLAARPGERSEVAGERVTSIPKAEWYSDASFLRREPISRTLHVARAIDEADEATPEAGRRRMFLTIQPQPELVGSDPSWTDARHTPRWLQVLARTAEVLNKQTVYDDIAAIDDVNVRVRLAAEASGRIGGAVGQLPVAAQRQLRAALVGNAADAPSLQQALHDLVYEAADVTGKSDLRLEVVSPLLVSRTEPIDDQLSGELFFRFGGFLQERLRASDYALGYRSVLRWAEAGGLRRIGVDEQTAATAVRATAAKASMAKQSSPSQRASLKARWGAARLIGRMARVAVHDLLTRRR